MSQLSQLICHGIPQAWTHRLPDQSDSFAKDVSILIAPGELCLIRCRKSSQLSKALPHWSVGNLRERTTDQLCLVTSP